MRLFRWLARGFHDGRIVEPGEEVLCDDDVIPGEHMLDVATGIRGPVAREGFDQPVFRRDLSTTAAMPIDEPVVHGSPAPEDAPAAPAPAPEGA